MNKERLKQKQINRFAASLTSYTAVTRLSGLLRGVTSNHNDFYCLYYFHSYSTSLLVTTQSGYMLFLIRKLFFCPQFP